jgi:hypothetical protein
MKISSEISQVVHANDDFKWEVRTEIDELRSLMWELKRLSGQPSSPGNHNTSSAYSTESSAAAGVMPPSTTSPVPGDSPGLHTIPDQSLDQSQMMSLFAASCTKFSEAICGKQETLSKLSIALSEKSETKSNWPKFSGDPKKFRAFIHHGTTLTPPLG